MPDLQIDQAMEIRNPRYLNDASSFRFTSKNLDGCTIAMIRMILLTQMTKLVRCLIQVGFWSDCDVHDHDDYGGHDLKGTAINISIV